MRSSWALVVGGRVAHFFHNGATLCGAKGAVHYYVEQTQRLCKTCERRLDGACDSARVDTPETAAAKAQQARGVGDAFFRAMGVRDA